MGTIFFIVRWEHNSIFFSNVLVLLCNQNLRIKQKCVSVRRLHWAGPGRWVTNWPFDCCLCCLCLECCFFGCFCSMAEEIADFPASHVVSWICIGLGQFLSYLFGRAGGAKQPRSCMLSPSPRRIRPTDERQGAKQQFLLFN
jgi:hypothetical protein